MTRIEDYLTFLEGHGRTPKTIKDYRLKLNEASTALAQGGLSNDPADTDEDAYLYLRRALHGSEDTVRQIMKAWDRFVGWCTGRRVLANAGLLWNRHQVRRTFISPADYARMLQAAQTPFERIILVLGGMVGCRRVEMLRLRTDDVGRDNIILRGKGHMAGLIMAQPINGTVQAEIRRYLAWHNTLSGSAHDPRFLILPSSRGGLISESTMEYTIPRAVVRIARRAGVEASTHTLRRLFGTAVYNATDHDLATTARLLRHADIATTVECYIEPSRAREMDALDRVCSALLG